MVIKQGHQPFVIYQPTLTQVKDDTPALLLGGRSIRPFPTFEDLIVHYLGERYWVEPNGIYTLFAHTAPYI